EPKMACLSTSSLHHLRYRIDTEHSARRADRGSDGQCRVSGTSSNIQNSGSTADQSFLVKSSRDRCEHLPDDLAVFVPERSSVAPSVYNVLVGLHEREYTVRG